MCKFSPKSGLKRIDPCMGNLISFINGLLPDEWKTVASCCGHRKYPMTIVVKTSLDNIYEICSDVYLDHKKKFYKKDKQGYYYIPEVVELREDKEKR